MHALLRTWRRGFFAKATMLLMLVLTALILSGMTIFAIVLFERNSVYESVGVGLLRWSIPLLFLTGIALWQALIRGEIK
jgi:hypothetical protein